MDKLSFVVSLISSLIFFVLIPMKINFAVGGTWIVLLTIFYTLSCSYIGGKVSDAESKKSTKKSKEYYRWVAGFFTGPFIIVLIYLSATH